MPETLTETEARILGALVEKQLTTPEYYPLTVNALVAACNQKTNRDPVVVYDEDTVTRSLDTLRDKNLAYVFHGSTSRVVKYKHMLPSVYELDPGETAIIAVLMLRGPQTIGELRERSGRLYEFGGLGDVSDTLDKLTRRDEPLVVKLERQTGQKDARFAHLLCGSSGIEAAVASKAVRAAQDPAKSDRVERLETEVALMRSEIEALKEAFGEFRKQFE
jgi:uncharacterized protein